MGPVRGHSGDARGDTRSQTRPPLQVFTVLDTTEKLAKDSVTRYLIPAFYKVSVFPSFSDCHIFKNFFFKFKKTFRFFQGIVSRAPSTI